MQVPSSESYLNPTWQWDIQPLQNDIISVTHTKPFVFVTPLGLTFLTNVQMTAWPVGLKKKSAMLLAKPILKS
jgi:hypothetical protein